MKFSKIASLAIGVSSVAADGTCTLQNSQSLDHGSTIVGADVAAALVLVLAVSRDNDKREVVRRQLSSRDLSCTSSELCVSLTGIPFCYNQGTTDFHTTDGITGNTISGNYQLPDGRKGNMYIGPYPHISGTVPSPTAGSATTSTGGILVSISSGPSTTAVVIQGAGVVPSNTPAAASVPTTAPGSVPASAPPSTTIINKNSAGALAVHYLNGVLAMAAAAAAGLLL